jgi:four helix bundle protein
MQSYKDLEIYQSAHNLAIEIHSMTLKLPQFEIYEEGSQIRKSSKAVASNIVEGFGRKRYQADYVKFLVYAHGSCDETREHLELLFESGSLKDEKQHTYFMENYEKLSRKINKFLQAFKD